MKKNTKRKLIFAFFVAFAVSAFNVLHKKYGGLLAGGVYSTSHSWQEIYNMLPSFLLFYFVVFIFAYFLFSIKYK
jgi:uncharacterized membrane-anchored protein YitT (DUF2179 family)